MNKRRNHTDPSVLQIRRSSLGYHGWTEFISRSSRNAALGSASPSMITRACGSGTVPAGSTERIFLSTVATSFETAWSGTAPDQRRSCGPRNALRLPDGNVACRDRDGGAGPDGASHGIGHVLGGTCDVPHRYTTCVMLPSVLRYDESVKRRPTRSHQRGHGPAGPTGRRRRLRSYQVVESAMHVWQDEVSESRRPRLRWLSVTAQTVSLSTWCRQSARARPASWVDGCRGCQVSLRLN
jgi:hypothetical protein